MAEIVTQVEVGNATLFVEARELAPGNGLAPESELEGIGGRIPDLSAVTEALSSFAGQIGDALDRAAPDRATVEFGCQLGLDAGRLTALVVQGSANGSLRVTLEWTKSSG
ncbi:CU044_2847 family protein [Streptomyces sp. NPDC056144]|uniref:CU044_2847 family protein n=1 Tax=unclassified Streptomyces TaxID=2593676 RepID=UPI0035D95853